jgi:VIT1/CCC1 family predicted Fe2+/Mn2+ transporter
VDDAARPDRKPPDPPDPPDPRPPAPSVFAPAEVPAGLVSGRWVVLLRDVILGGQDGLVNVLGLSLGLAAATGDARVILTAGIAAAMAESIAMAGVAFTASGAEGSWARLVGERSRGEMAGRAGVRAAGIGSALRADGWPDDRVAVVGAVLAAERDGWLAEVDDLRAALAPVRERHPARAAAIVGVSTLVGSSIPLAPFVVLPVEIAVAVSLVVGASVLAIVGGLRARAVGGRPLRPALEMVAIGLLSALAGFAIGILLRAPAA